MDGLARHTAQPKPHSCCEGCAHAVLATFEDLIRYVAPCLLFGRIILTSLSNTEPRTPFHFFPHPPPTFIMALVDAVASDMGIASLGIQIGDNLMKIKDFWDNVKEALGEMDHVLEEI